MRLEGDQTTLSVVDVELTWERRHERTLSRRGGER